MSPSPEAVAHQAQRQELAKQTALAVLAQWAQIDPERVNASWQYLLSRVTEIVMACQLTAARQSEAYMRELLGEVPEEGVMQPAAFAAGFAATGQPLAALLALPIPATLGALKAGASLREALAKGAAMVDLLVRSIIADTGRQADQVAMTARPGITSYVRVVELPSCARCLILAGREYSHSTGFLRHPRCDCTMEPVTRDHRPEPVDARDVYNRMTDAQKRHAFGEAGVKAIADGADIARVVNARKGMRTVEMYGRQVRATYAGTGRRRANRRPPRLLPEAIYQIADSREEQIRLLRRNGYIR